jgi:hypothetical protein
MTDLINQTLVALENTDKTSNIFTIDEAAAKPSIGKLAADHAEAHQATEEDGDHDKRPAIEAKIMKHYGRGTTEAIKDHSGRVNDVENKSGPGGPSYINFHGKFIKNHLGGHGSAEHKEYQKRMAHHGHEDAPHQHEKDWNEHASTPSEKD